MYGVRGRTDSEAIRAAWAEYPYRVTNNRIDPAFVAGWDAGHVHGALNCPHANEVDRLRAENERLRRELGAM